MIGESEGTNTSPNKNKPFLDDSGEGLFFMYTVFFISRAESLPSL
jgi:hypothetical protein